MKHVFTVLLQEQGVSLAALLAERVGCAPAEAVQRVAAGSVYVDGRRQRRLAQCLRAGQKIVAYDPDAKGGSRPDANEGGQPAVPTRWACVDDHVIVLDKPPGTPSMPTRGGGSVSVADVLAERAGSEVRLLHRLDRQASGLLLASCRQDTRAMLAEQVRQHQLVRRYLAVVRGSPARHQWVIRAPIGRQKGRALVGGGAAVRPAETEVRLIERSGALCLLQVTPKTGRMHQIRAHLASEGLPLCGDDRYGGPAAPRLALHAHCLGFLHPTGGTVEVHSPMPPELRRLIGSGPS